MSTLFKVPAVRVNWFALKYGGQIDERNLII